MKRFPTGCLLLWLICLSLIPLGWSFYDVCDNKSVGRLVAGALNFNSGAAWCLFMHHYNKWRSYRAIKKENP